MCIPLLIIRSGMCRQTMSLASLLRSFCITLWQICLSLGSCNAFLCSFCVPLWSFCIVLQSICVPLLLLCFFLWSFCGCVAVFLFYFLVVAAYLWSLLSLCGYLTSSPRLYITPYQASSANKLTCPLTYSVQTAGVATPGHPLGLVQPSIKLF